MAEYEGVISYFNEQKGYGFISSKFGKKIYVHFSAIKGKGYKTLSEGQKVRFELAADDDELRAVNVVKL
jgi:CspA family cold shock protein